MEQLAAVQTCINKLNKEIEECIMKLFKLNTILVQKENPELNIDFGNLKLDKILEKVKTLLPEDLEKFLLQTDKSLTPIINAFEEKIEEFNNKTTEYQKELTVGLENQEFEENNKIKRAQLSKLYQQYNTENRKLIDLIKEKIKNLKNLEHAKSELESKIHEKEDVLKRINSSIDVQLNLNSKLCEGSIVDTNLVEERKEYLNQIKR